MGYNFKIDMVLLVKIFIRILEVMFFGGMIGSAVVILMTSIQDVKVFLEPAHPDETHV